MSLIIPLGKYAIAGIYVEAVGFEKPLNARGTSPDNPASEWAARISFLDQSLPDLVSRSPDPSEALDGALSLLPTLKSSAKFRKPSRKPTKAELAEIDDLI